MKYAYVIGAVLSASLLAFVATEAKAGGFFSGLGGAALTGGVSSGISALGGGGGGVNWATSLGTGFIVSNDQADGIQDAATSPTVALSATTGVPVDLLKQQNQTAMDALNGGNRDGFLTAVGSMGGSTGGGKTAIKNKSSEEKTSSTNGSTE